ncbi:MAG: AMP-binding protein [Bacteroidota bacterium]
MFNPEIETLPLDQLRNLQSERLSNMLDRIYRKVPFYTKQFDEAGIRPSDIKGIQDLHKLPFTRKNDLRDNYPFGMFAEPMPEINRIHASSGTTGKPTVVGYTKKDLDIFSGVCARSLAAAGAKKGMKLHNAYGYGLFTGGLGMHYGGELLGMAVIPVSGGMTERQIRLLIDFKSDVICCTPSYAQTLAGEFKKRGIPPEELALQFAVLGAEPWTEMIREEVEAGLGVVATNIYGLSEIIGPGVSQEDWEEKNGSYVWEDHFFPEIVHPDTGEPLPEGEDGVLVFTTLTKEGMPLLRYWTNDICNLFYDTSGKRTHVKMSAIKGRADDMLIIRGVNLFPTQVEELIGETEEFAGHYQLVITRDKVLDEVELKIELEEGFYGRPEFGFEPEKSDGVRFLEQKLAAKIKGTIGVSMMVDVVPFEEIPRSVGGKLSRVLDKRG